jgi:hypothetical protein
MDDALGYFLDDIWMSDFRVGSVEFTKIHWHDMILYSGDDPLRHYNLQLQQRRMKSKEEDQIFMIKVAQHDWSFLEIAWDLGILWVDSLAVDIDRRTNCYF